jgi:hypothetical protein
MPTVVHGRKTLLHASRLDPLYRRAVFFDPNRFTPVAYRAEWGRRMLNADQQLVTWNEAALTNAHSALFIRPNDDDKRFTGRVFARGEFAMLGESEPNAMVVIARPRDIDAEARFFVVEREIVGASFYRPNADPRVPSAMLEFAREAAAAWGPDDVYTLDVARVEGTFAIVEANCFNGSRFYGADVVSIVRRVSAWQLARWS